MTGVVQGELFRTILYLCWVREGGVVGCEVQEQAQHSAHGIVRPIISVHPLR